MEQAFYFEPYQESVIQIEPLQALRSSNLDQLKLYQQVKCSKKKNQDQHQDEKDDSSLNDDFDNFCCKKNIIVDLKACNQFGENLLHLASRIGIHKSLLEFF